MSGTLALIGGSVVGGGSAHDGGSAAGTATSPGGGTEPTVDDHHSLFEAGTTVELLPTAMAYENPGQAIAGATELIAGMGAEVHVLSAMNRADSFDEELASTVRSADAIYVTGGSPMHLRSALKDTPLLDALVGAWSRGATVAVAAESCSVLCSHMVDNRGGAFTVGLGLITTMTVIPRFGRWSADKLSRTISLAPSEVVVAGIDEDAALVRAPDGSWGVTGSGSVHVFAEGKSMDLDELPRTLNPDAGF